MKLNRLLIVAFTVLTLPAAAGAEEPIPPAASDLTVAVWGNNAFAIDLYKQLQSQPGNLFFSPESISTALAMTYAGARGETATEMANTLHFTLPPDKLHPAMGQLLQGLNAAHDGYQLKVANALWAQEGYNFVDDFLKLTKDKYGAGLNQVDFKGDSEAARQTINSWVEEQTENKIKDLIGPGVLDTKTRLVLTNAIYFKGDWQKQFKKEDTKDEDFHLSSTQTLKASLMHIASGFNYYETPIFQALEIAYKNKELSMIAFLPKDADGLAAFEQTMTADNLQQWLGRLMPVEKVIVTIPKFKMESQVGLNDLLQTMGMKQAFNGKIADFSGIAPREEMQHNGNLYISAVVHKAYVDFNEEGTEAAAATAMAITVAVCAGCKPPPPPLPPIFLADHPFLFLIRDNRSSCILFMGRVAAPSN